MPAVRTQKGQGVATMNLKRSASASGGVEDAFHLTWTSPPPPSLSSPGEPTISFSFAPNVTPGTFIAPPPSEDEEIPSEESSLFPEPPAVGGGDGDGLPELVAPANSMSSNKRRKRSAKSSASTPAPDDIASPTSPSSNALDCTTNPSSEPAHIPRPPNAFILFRSSFIRSQHVSAQIEGNHGTLSKIVGMVWHALPFREREVWQAKARKALAEHRRKYPGYSFRPAKDRSRGGGGAGGGNGNGGNSGGTGGSGGGASEDGRAKRDGSIPPTSTSSSTSTTGTTTKRKQREVGPRDVARCEQIAALLSKGLKGKDLEDAIKEFDAKRAPVVITPRFEVPITALQYEGGGGVSSKMSTTTTTPKQELDTMMDTMQMQGMDDQRPSVRKYRRSSSAPLLEAEHSKAAQFMRSASPSPLSSAPFSTMSATTAYTSPPRPQSSFASSTSGSGPASASGEPRTPTQPTYRTQRKRSTSSSPPLRQRTLMTQASLQCMNFYQPHHTQPQHTQQSHQQQSQPPQLTLNTASLGAYGVGAQAGGPMSAPVDSASSSSYMYGQEGSADVFFDIDGSDPSMWYASPSASAAGSSVGGLDDAGMGGGSEFGVGGGFVGQDSWANDFNTFSFHATPSSAISPSAATSPIKPSPLSPLSNITSAAECYSPFQQTPPPNSSSQDVVDPSMPMLVERPYDPLDHQLEPMVQLQSSHLQQNQQQAHQHLAAPIPHHALQIQTTNLPSWSTPSASASEYSHTHSPHDPYSTHHFGGGAYDASSQHQALTPYASSVSDYDYGSMGTGAGSPTSPSTASQAHTPREGSADICASFPSANAQVSYNGFKFEGYYPGEHEQQQHESSKMLVQQHGVGMQGQQGVGMQGQGQGQGGHGGMMIDMEALNGALAPFM
ncbi:hypothetical protein SCHPADRAFT_944719 [Schizopora paradoxa]|uniref:HMG box domain-containing protein n=1 Tax=Schizopora paradoxa TaxID=27342 RepID=A0A0H2RTF6_9AGAM|nr:hypothetical protein SCHPADRAFT_944719 [Schizopora paradoxa]